MMKKGMKQIASLGVIALLIAVVLPVLLMLMNMTAPDWWATLVVLLGIALALLGFVKKSEEIKILLAAAVLSIVSGVTTQIPFAGGYLGAAAGGLFLLVSPIALITAIAVLWKHLSK